MLDLYKSIQNSIGGLNSALRIAISNADNFNTPGFKYTTASFTSIYNQSITSGTESTNPVTIGGSMTLGSTNTDFSQGNISIGTALDSAIVGEGFLILSKSGTEFTESSPKVFTRLGRFKVDFANQFLTDTFGRKVFGYKVDANGNPVSRTLVPLQTDGNTDVGFTAGGILVTNFQKNKDDIASGVNPPTATVPLYRLALTTFTNKQGLIPVEGTAYSTTQASGQPLEPGSAEEGPYGNILGSSLESSNIDVARIALDMALLNRGYSAVQGLVDDLNKILSGLISKLQ